MGHILEGSVQKAAGQVRVNVRLINAQTESHLWADTYDRKLTDIFAIQTDLARNIAAALGPRCSPRNVNPRLNRQPTSKYRKAYLVYLQALLALSISPIICGDLKKVLQGGGNRGGSGLIRILRRRLPVNSTRAKCHFFNPDAFRGGPGRVRRPRKSEALSRPEAGSPRRSSRARLLLLLRRSGLRARPCGSSRSLSHDLPNESEAFLGYCVLSGGARANGAESTANLEKAASLNPKVIWPLQNLAFNYQMLRNFDAANKTIDRALQIDPHGIGLWTIKAKLAIGEKGNLSVGEKLLEKAKSVPMTSEEQVKMIGAEANLLLTQRKYQEVLQLVATVPDDSIAAVPGRLALKYFSLGIAHKALGDDAAARAAFLKAKDILEVQLKQKPDDADVRVQFAKLLAWLGEKDTAIAEAQRAIDLRPESKDAFEGLADH